MVSMRRPDTPRGDCGLKRFEIIGKPRTSTVKESSSVLRAGQRSEAVTPSTISTDPSVRCFRLLKVLNNETGSS